MPATEPPQPTDGWDSFFDALNDTEREAIAILLDGGADIKKFADGNGIMLEVLLDGINDKAADHVGDSLLETGGDVRIYDEYAEAVKRMSTIQ
jgi:hypothetical protein